MDGAGLLEMSVSIELARSTLEMLLMSSSQRATTGAKGDGEEKKKSTESLAV